MVLPAYDQPLTEGDLLSQLQDVEIEFSVQKRDAVPKEKIQRTPKATRESVKRVQRDKYLGTGGITAENAGHEELEFLES